jgi:uncharacterized protein (DUF1800 family)
MRGLWLCALLGTLACGGVRAQAPAPRVAQAAKPLRRTPARHQTLKKLASSALTERERVVQLLDRFTFGPRPGDVERVLAQGVDAWMAQQMEPASINDSACDRRLGQYPTLNMSPAQVLNIFPDRPQIGAVADGKAPYPTDPMMRGVFEVQVAKLLAERDQKKPDGTVQSRPEPTDAEKAAKKQADQAEASQMFGQLMALPKNQRMGSILAFPVEERIVLTGNGNLTGDQHNLLFNDFSPRERETFQAMSGQVSSTGNIGNELAQGRILRDILTERQLLEVMTDFWFNHFNVFIGKDSDQWYTTSYERDVIRKHALGKFGDLLLATAQSPAMMVYLDNWLSIGPDSLANGVDPRNPKSRKGNKGLNENYGREVMELHTVGVNGGYSQADVTALSAILTGWGVNQPQNGGGFQFDFKRHEPGPKVWFGYSIDEQGNAARIEEGAAAQTFGPSSTAATPRSVQQGLTALRILAAAPQTAHFISYLLAQRFVADEPPPTLVDRLTQTYLQSDGDTKAVLRALIASPEFNSRQNFRTKVKTPVEFVASVFRSTGTDPVNPGALVNTVRQMGMEMYHALPPTGYYLTADHWMNSVALVDRINFAYQLTGNHYANQKFDAPKLLATGLMLPEATPAVVPGKAMRVSASGDLPTSSAGQETALHVLENTIIGGPVSAKTNQLIDEQMTKQPPNSSATDTLNVLAALVLGSPEFQNR